MKEKIKVLVTPDDKSGVGFMRSIWPHEYIQEHYSDEFDIDIIYMKDFPKDDIVGFFQQYDIFVYHKHLDRHSKIIDLVRFLGDKIGIVQDLDDNFVLGPDHPLHLSSVRNNWSQLIIDHTRKSDYITTTTPIFADIIKKHNKNVVVLPNAIDVDLMPQFKQEKKKSDRIRFGLVCGSTHMRDIELMNGINMLPKEIMDKIQIVLCGVDYNGSVTIWDRKTGQSTVRPIEPAQSIWMQYQKFLTNDYSIVSPEHKKWLLEYHKEDDPFENEAYRSFMTKGINEYSRHYENVDVLLAPLKVNDFNKTKSQLKAIEAAYTDTAIVASDFGPYQIDLKPYIKKGGVIDPEGNALLVDESKNHKQWAKYITYIVNHPECIDVMKANLKRDLCEKYSLENVSKARVELYRKIYAEKHKED